LKNQKKSLNNNFLIHLLTSWNVWCSKRLQWGIHFTILALSIRVVSRRGTVVARVSHSGPVVQKIAGCGTRNCGGAPDVKVVRKTFLETFNTRSVEKPVLALHFVRGSTSEHGRVTPLRHTFEVQVFAVPQVLQVCYRGVGNNGKIPSQASLVAVGGRRVTEVAIVAGRSWSGNLVRSEVIIGASCRDDGSVGVFPAYETFVVRNRLKAFSKVNGVATFLVDYFNCFILIIIVFYASLNRGRETGIGPFFTP